MLSVLLLGAGELGTAFIHALLPFHPSITLAVRDPSRYSDLAIHAIQFLTLDVLALSESALASHFSEYDVILSATGFVLPANSQLHLARAALQAGKRRKREGKPPLRYFPWQWGVDYDITGSAGGLMPLFGEQLAVRELLRTKAGEAGVAWTIVSTGIFMSFLFEGSFGVVEAVGEEVAVRALGSWENRVTVTTVEDIARIAARLVCQPDGVETAEKVVYAAGETISYGRLAKVVEQVVPKNIKKEVWEVEYLKGELAKDPENMLKKYRVVFAKGSGVSWDEEGTVNRAWGMAVTGVDTWARDKYKV